MADNLEQLVQAAIQEVMQEQAAGKTQPAQSEAKPFYSTGGNRRFTTADYPVMEKHKDLVKTPSGRPVDDITVQAIQEGSITIEDVRISKEMLYAQGDIAESAGKPAMKENLLRAAELTEVPDDVVISMYDKLRPNRATAKELQDMANTLETIYNAPLCAQLVREACEVYAKRGILLD